MRSRSKTFLLSMMAAASMSAAPAIVPPDDETTIEIVRGEGDGPLRPLPFSLNLDRLPPTSLREMVEKIYEAIPEAQLAKIGSYYGHHGYRRALSQFGNEREFFRSLYIREIIYSAYQTWGFLESNPLGERIACVDPKFIDQVGLQLGMMYIYYSQDGPIRFESNVTYAYSQAEFISRRLFEVCEASARAPSPQAP